MNPRFSVLIANSDLLRCEIVAQACRAAIPGWLIEFQHTSQSTLASLHSRTPWLLIMGVNFSEGDGLEILTVVETENLCSRVLVVAARKDECTMSRVSGCTGWFDPYEGGLQELISAVQRVSNGHRYFSPSIQKFLMNSPADPLGELLSPAELRVLLVIADGTSDKAAAERLSLSFKTVHTHRQKIMKSLGVSDVQELMREAVRRGIVRIRMDGRLVICSNLSAFKRPRNEVPPSPNCGPKTDTGRRSMSLFEPRK